MIRAKHLLLVVGILGTACKSEKQDKTNFDANAADVVAEVQDPNAVDPAVEDVSESVQEADAIIPGQIELVDDFSPFSEQIAATVAQVSADIDGKDVAYTLEFDEDELDDDEDNLFSLYFTSLVPFAMTTTDQLAVTASTCMKDALDPTAKAKVNGGLVYIQQEETSYPEECTQIVIKETLDKLGEVAGNQIIEVEVKRSMQKFIECENAIEVIPGMKVAEIDGLCGRVKNETQVFTRQVNRFEVTPEGVIIQSLSSDTYTQVIVGTADNTCKKAFVEDSTNIVDCKTIETIERDGVITEKIIRNWANIEGVSQVLLPQSGILTMEVNNVTAEIEFVGDDSYDLEVEGDGFDEELEVSNEFLAELNG